MLKIGTRQITVDIAFGGEFYAIADSEAIGIPIDIANAARSSAWGVRLQMRLNRPCTSSIRSMPA